jgi:methionine aminopeptidase
VSKTAQTLLDVTREALFYGIAAAGGNRMGDIGHAVDRT